MNNCDTCKKIIEFQKKNLELYNKLIYDHDLDLNELQSTSNSFRNDLKKMLDSCENNCLEQNIIDEYTNLNNILKQMIELKSLQPTKQEIGKSYEQEIIEQLKKIYVPSGNPNLPKIQHINEILSLSDLTDEMKLLLLLKEDINNYIKDDRVYKLIKKKSTDDLKKIEIQSKYKLVANDFKKQQIKYLHNKIIEYKKKLNMISNQKIQILYDYKIGVINKAITDLNNDNINLLNRINSKNSKNDIIKELTYYNKYLKYKNKYLQLRSK
jgi:hypothetical protein